MIECPDSFIYSHRHVWVQIEDSGACIARIGITEHLQEELPEILSIDMPMTGDELEIDIPCIHLHLESGIQEVYAPLTGRVEAINREVLDNPDHLHMAPYKNWIMRVEYDEEQELELLMDAETYTQFVESL